MVALWPAFFVYQGVRLSNPLGSSIGAERCVGGWVREGWNWVEVGDQLRV